MNEAPKETRGVLGSKGPKSRLFELFPASGNLQTVHTWQGSEKLHVKLRGLLSLPENELRMAFFRIEFQFQFLQENQMAKLAADK